MGKYLSIVLAMMVVTMAIAFLSPTTGELRPEPFYPLFWASVAGAIAVIIYGSYQNRKKQQELRRERRNKRRR